MTCATRAGAGRCLHGMGFHHCIVCACDGYQPMPEPPSIEPVLNMMRARLVADDATADLHRQLDEARHQVRFWRALWATLALGVVIVGALS